MLYDLYDRSYRNVKPRQLPVLISDDRTRIRTEAITSNQLVRGGLIPKRGRLTHADTFPLQLCLYARSLSS